MKNLFLLLFLTVPLHADVSITFDDGFKSQVKNALPILQKYGLRATFYIVPSFLNTPRYMDWWDIKHLDATGQEIANHTLSHPDLTKIYSSQVIYQIKTSQNILKLHGYNAVSFAPPFGSVNSEVQKEISRYFVSSRAAWKLGGVAINDGNHLDRYNLTAIALNENSNFKQVKNLISKADRYNKFLIFMLHNVQDDCGSNREYCVSTTHLNEVAKYCIKNKVHVVTVKQYFAEHGIN